MQYLLPSFTSIIRTAVLEDHHPVQGCGHQMHLHLLLPQLPLHLERRLKQYPDTIMSKVDTHSQCFMISLTSIDFTPFNKSSFLLTPIFLLFVPLSLLLCLFLLSSSFSLFYFLSFFSLPFFFSLSLLFSFFLFPVVCLLTLCPIHFFLHSSDHQEQVKRVD